MNYTPTKVTGFLPNYINIIVNTDLIDIIDIIELINITNNTKIIQFSLFQVSWQEFIVIGKS